MFLLTLWVQISLTILNFFFKILLECKCNNHASSCVYNPVTKSGQCQNCQDKTKGANCDECKAGYFRNVSFGIESPNACSGLLLFIFALEGGNTKLLN